MIQLAEAPVEYDPDRVYDIPLKEILVDEEFNCRGFINPMDLIDLAKSIKAEGLHTPVFVTPWDTTPGKKFKLVAGFRRYKAHILNEDDEEYQTKRGPKAHTIRALVKSGLDDAEARWLNLSENLQRTNLNMKQEAHAIEWFKDHGWSEFQVGDKLKMSRGWVQVRFMLLDLPDDVQNEAAAGLLTQQQIRTCYSIRENPDAVFAFVREIKDKKLLGKKRDVKPVTSEKRMRTETELFQMQDKLRETWGNDRCTRVIGWAAGLVDDDEIQEFLRTQASLDGKFYLPPVGLGKLPGAA